MPVSIDPDQQKNEETTKLRYITPVIWERWQDVDKVLMEYYFTDGRISVDEYNMAHRGKPKKADYLLLYRDNIPLAIVEAKAIDHSADEGYSQAVEYANILDVPFAYATNGDDPTSITKIVMPVFVRKDTGSNTVYIDATYSIDPQARTATPIVNLQ